MSLSGSVGVDYKSQPRHRSCIDDLWARFWNYISFAAFQYLN